MESRIRTHIVPTLGATELRNLKPSAIQAWVRGRHGELAPSYTRLLLGNLSTILAAAVEDGRIASNPSAVSSVKAPKVSRRKVVPWTIDTAQRVTAGHPVEFTAASILGAGCGLRQGEILGLIIDNIDFLRRVVHVRQHLRRVGNTTVLAPPKGGKEREVPLPDVVAVALAEHIRRFGETRVMLPWLEPDGPNTSAGLIFTNRNREPVTRAYYMHNAWKPALAFAGVERKRENGMHALRHHYASVLLDGGVSIRAVSEYLGHHDPGFTLRTYAHLMPESEDRTRNVVDAAHASGPAESTRNGIAVLT